MTICATWQIRLNDCVLQLSRFCTVMPHSPYTLPCTVPLAPPPKFAPYPSGSIPPWFLGLTWPTIPIIISIKSAIFPQYTLVTDGRTNQRNDDDGTLLLPTDHFDKVGTCGF